MSLESFIDKASTRQSKTELEAESELEEVQERFKVLINKPSERNDGIRDWFLKVYINRLSDDIGSQAAKGLAVPLAKLVDLPVDELMKVPVFQRSMLWDVAFNMIIAISSRQATHESGLITKSLIDGIENAADLAESKKGMTEKEIKEATIDMKFQMRTKKKNGNTTKS